MIGLSTLAAWLVIGCVEFAGPSFAQSVDPNHPTPLGPGINKGNITSDVPGHYYTFVAGPGHIDVDMAFKEMGLFGNPYRQLLNFDFYTADGKLSSHNTVVSQGAIAHGHTDGDIQPGQKFTLVVTTQKALIRVGGYYEIEIKGAVTFGGGAVGSGTKPLESETLVKPQSEPLVRPQR